MAYTISWISEWSKFRCGGIQIKLRLTKTDHRRLLTVAYTPYMGLHVEPGNSQYRWFRDTSLDDTVGMFVATLWRFRWLSGTVRHRFVGRADQTLPSLLVPQSPMVQSWITPLGSDTEVLFQSQVSVKSVGRFETARGNEGGSGGSSLIYIRDTK